MCGITGFFNPASTHNHDVMRGHVSAMASTIAHRGPGGHSRVRLGHRRLSIIDLSDAANQPFVKDPGKTINDPDSCDASCSPITGSSTACDPSFGWRRRRWLSREYELVGL